MTRLKLSDSAVLKQVPMSSIFELQALDSSQLDSILDLSHVPLNTACKDPLPVTGKDSSLGVSKLFVTLESSRDMKN